MAEQFAFEQRFANRSHIDAEHRAGGTGREAVNLPRQHLFPGSVLARYQYVGIGSPLPCR